MKNSSIFLALGFLLLQISCSREDEELMNTDLLFYNSEPIHVTPYTYTDEFGKTYLIKGDTFYYTQIPDTVNNKPNFIWDSIYGGIATVAIFSNPIQVEGYEIVNQKDAVWQWHSFMEDGFEGNVKFSDGKPVHNGEIDYSNNPSDLLPGKYYWAVWKWNSEGIKIKYSSRIISFYVRE